MTRFLARGHVQRGCSAHQMKGLETLMCLATKILKIGPKLWELETWHSKYPETFYADILSALIYSLWLVTLMSGSGYLDCQGHNSPNFGLIFKILVAKHICVSRPFIWSAEHQRQVRLWVSCWPMELMSSFMMLRGKLLCSGRRKETMQMLSVF